MTENINANLATELAQNGAKMTPLAFDNLMAGWFKDNFKRLKNLAGDEESARKIFLMALNVASKNPMLLQCDPKSFMNCILTSCELGLYPGPTQECAYIPFKDNGRLVATFVPMYQGMVKLAFNSGFVRDVQAAVVYEKDEFEFELGTNKFLRHKPFLGPVEERGKRVCVYGVITTLHGSHLSVKSIDFIEGIKARSRGAKSQFSPWNGSDDDYDAMACKTIFKQGAKFVPKSITLQQAIEKDNEIEAETPPKKQNPIIDITESTKAALPPVENSAQSEGKK